MKITIIMLVEIHKIIDAFCDWTFPIENDPK